MSRKLTKRGRFLTYAKGVLAGKDPAVADQLSVFDRLRDELSTRVAMLTYNKTVETSAISSDIRETLNQQGLKNDDFRDELRAAIKEVKGAPGKTTQTWPSIPKWPTCCTPAVSTK